MIFDSVCNTVICKVSRTTEALERDATKCGDRERDICGLGTTWLLATGIRGGPSRRGNIGEEASRSSATTSAWVAAATGGGDSPCIAYNSSSEIGRERGGVGGSPKPSIDNCSTTNKDDRHNTDWNQNSFWAPRLHLPSAIFERFSILTRPLISNSTLGALVCIHWAQGPMGPLVSGGEEVTNYKVDHLLEPRCAPTRPIFAGMGAAGMRWGGGSNGILL